MAEKQEGVRIRKMWFKNEAYESKDKYEKFVESLDYWEHLHLSMALYCLNHPDASNDEAYAECLEDGEPSLAYRLNAACHIENNSRDKANTDKKLGDMSLSVDIDTTTAQRTLQAIKAKMSTAVSIEKQPHVRIEFDDINDVPHVWIDGKQVDNYPNTALVSVDLNWHTRDQVLEHGNQNQYKIEYLDGGKRVGIAQGNVFSNELFKK